MYVKVNYNTQTLIVESVEVVINGDVPTSPGNGILYSEISNLPSSSLANLLSNPTYYKYSSGALVLISGAPSPLPGRKISNANWNTSVPMALDRANTIKGFATF